MTVEQASLRERPGQRAEDAIAQRAWGQPRLPFAPLELLSADHIEAIHQASLQVLEEIGMDMLLPEAREILARAGASVAGERVRIGREIVERALETVPAEFTFHARNPAHDIVIGGDRIAFAPVGGPPFSTSIDRGRRPGSFADNADFIRLAQYFNCVHTAGGGSVDAIDLHASIRHLHVYRSKLTLADKVVFVSSTGRNRLLDGVEMVRIARGIDRERLEREPSCFTVINTNSPLKLDGPMGMGIIELARLNQIVCVTPFTLAGAMAPVTLAGALVEQNAEALAGLALSQLARPGAPFIYGGFTSNVDMKSGAPAFGTPEYMKSAVIGGQLARRYRLPYRTSNTNAANTVDAQAAYESVFSLWGAVMGGGNLVLHAAGWLEGGLVASFEKFMLDVELLEMVMAFLEPLDTGSAALAREAIREVEPGAHPFGARHAQERCARGSHAPLLSGWRNHQQWLEAGKPEAWQNANRLWKQALAEYREPPMEAGIREALDAFVDRRVREGGEKTDF